MRCVPYEKGKPPKQNERPVQPDQNGRTMFETVSHRVAFGEYEAQVYTCGNAAAQPVILLHGFMQEGRSWEAVARMLYEDYFFIMPDLPGHGATLLPQEPQTFSLDAHCLLVDKLVTGISFLFKNPFQKPILVGYSMGGRIAATYACWRPERIAAVVLESAGLGPLNEEERSARKQKNEQLCKQLLEQPFEKFIDAWEALPLFDSQKRLPKRIQQAQRQVRLRNNPKQLACSLRYAGQHMMNNVREELAQSALPILYMAGELDVTYTKVARSLCAYANASNHIAVEIIEGAGHNIHLEKPEIYCSCFKRKGSL